MMNLRPFQIALLGLFVLLAIAGIVGIRYFSGSATDTINPYGQSVEIWGTFSNIEMSRLLSELKTADPNFSVVSYVERDPRSFNNDLLNAIAEGRAPDLIILRHDALVEYRGKLLAVPYENYPLRNYKDTYIDGAEIFALQDGIYALPFAVDPMVMYWNRSIFSTARLVAPPSSWEQLVSETVPAITEVDDNLDIEKTAIAFGEYGNVRHAKDVLSLLMLQSGSDIVEERSSGYSVVLQQNAENSLPAGEASLGFYTQFANTANRQYAWNRSLPVDYQYFLSGKLGLYFGLGTEYESIARDNPNLDFDLAPVPQGAGATVHRNYGIFYGLSILRASDNPQGAYLAASKLASAEVSSKLAEAYSLAPVRRQLLAAPKGDPVESVRYKSAVVARGWLDPARESTELIFRRMIEDVTSGRSYASQAVYDAIEKMRLLFNPR